MPLTPEGATSRRFAIGSVVLGATGFALPWKAQFRVITLRGMTGGGLARFETSAAQFSVFATRVTFEEEGEDAIFGSVLWVDEAAGYTFVSTEVTDYEMLEEPVEKGRVRLIRGTMRVNDGEEHPFLLNVTDKGMPGSGEDSVALIVGPDALVEEGVTAAAQGFAYAAAGSVEIGDLQDVDFEFGPEAAKG